MERFSRKSCGATSVGAHPLDRRTADFLIALCILACLLYVFVPLVYQNRFCPPDTFLTGGMSSGGVLIGGMLLAFCCATLLILGFTSNKDGRSAIKIQVLARFAEYYRTAFFVAMSFGLFIGVCSWVNFFTSYYCATPYTIIVHPWALAPQQSLTWSRVDMVVTYCGSTKSSKFGAVALRLDDGRAIEVKLHLDDFNALRMALNGKHYRYGLNATVAPDICPRDLYPLFLGWQRDRH